MASSSSLRPRNAGFPAAPHTTLSKSSHDPRKHVGVHFEHVSNVSNTEYPGHYPGEDHSWNLGKFKQGLRVVVQRVSQRSIEFDLVGVDASIANAFRRIIIAEVPMIAIENVYVWNNTSVIVDEVLSHRLGLVPLNVDPAVLEPRTETGFNSQPNDRNTLVFKLKVACERNPRVAKGAPGEYINDEVKSGHLVWTPQGEQPAVSVFAKRPPAATNPDIVLAKLRPGQEIDMELHAVKGVGQDHAKFCPVATATYRTHPLIILNPSKPVPRHLAKKFAQCFSPGVVTVDDDGNVSIEERNMRRDSVSREVLRHREFDGCVELKRIRDHFIFNVESEGPYAPERLFLESVTVMRDKIATIKRSVEALMSGGPDGAAANGADVDVEMAGT
ncbi:hypothetical protein NLI96_g1853 [Meripilus lineatus]|uniref:DNA-directed RNA polymerases I and III subunit RPAC1 n=1 Tax=Meripilus lineatus TaxID=2056292 RepID=A0AAD5YHZ0_9APHY|nr:hypothetical protein NLI96_g1853 [Physisporinus lineatus]